LSLHLFIFDLSMGDYLSTPNKVKHSSEG
jgi:hypothetical protein